MNNWTASNGSFNFYGYSGLFSLTAVAVNDYIQLNWIDIFDGQVAYDIYAGVNGEEPKLIGTTGLGAITFNAYVKQNADLTFRIAVAGINDLSVPALIRTPLVFSSDQTGGLVPLVFANLNIAVGGTINVNWGDGTDNDYAGNNAAVTHNYGDTLLYYVHITGDVNMITRLEMTGQVDSGGNLSDWLLPTGLTYFDLNGCSFTGNLDEWILSAGLTDFILYNNAFTGNLTKWVTAGMPAGMTTFQIHAVNYFDTKANCNYIIDKYHDIIYASAKGLPGFEGNDLVIIINQCIQALRIMSKDGGTIHIKAARYENLMGHINILGDHVTIEGEGKWQTVLKIADDWDVLEPYPTTAFIHCENNNHYFTLRNIEIDGNGLNQTFINALPAPLVARGFGVTIWNNGSNPFFALIDNCYIHDFTVNGVTVAGTLCTVRDCKVEYNYANQITVSGASNGCKIHDNIVGMGADVNIACYGTDNDIYNNFVGNVDGTAGTVNSYDAICIEGGNTALKPFGLHIYNNHIIAPDAIHGIAQYFQSDNCKIEGNYIYDINRAGASCTGIYLVDARKASVINNKVMNVDDYGIYLNNCPDCFVSGNHVDIGGAATAALNLITTALRNIIINNFFSNTNGYGIMVGTGCNDNKFIGNYIRGSWADYNIHLAATGTIFENNYGYLTGNNIIEGKGQTTGTVITKRFLLGHPGDTGCDFTFAADANHNQQNLDLGAIVPAKARVLQVEAVCTESINVGEILISAGTASGGTQYFTLGSLNAANEVRGFDISAAANPAMIWNAASNVWIGADPDNNWNTLNAGKWSIYVTYIQYN